MRFVYSVLLLLLTGSNADAMGWVGGTIDGVQCTGNAQGHGPFDYFEVLAHKDSPLWSQARLWEVNQLHYERGVRLLASGFSRTNAESAYSEFDYTLRAFPNHIPALHEMMKLQIRKKQIGNDEEIKLLNFLTPPECYFQRAISYKSNQPQLHLLFAIYLHKLKAYDWARKHYVQAISINELYSEAYYNYGLMLIDVGDLASAKLMSDKAYKLGFPLSGLKDRLKEMSSK